MYECEYDCRWQFGWHVGDGVREKEGESRRKTTNSFIPAAAVPESSHFLKYCVLVGSRADTS